MFNAKVFICITGKTSEMQMFVTNLTLSARVPTLSQH